MRPCCLPFFQLKGAYFSFLFFFFPIRVEFTEINNLFIFIHINSMSTRAVIAECLPNHNLGILVPVLERFVVCTL